MRLPQRAQNLMAIALSNRVSEMRKVEIRNLSGRIESISRSWMNAAKTRRLDNKSPARFGGRTLRSGRLFPIQNDSIRRVDFLTLKKAGPQYARSYTKVNLIFC